MRVSETTPMRSSDVQPFVEALEKLRSPREVGDAFTDCLRPFGFIAVAAGESRELAEGRSWEFFFNTWPGAWLAQYQANDYVRHDLVPAMARLSATPFTWRDALADRTPTEKQREHYDWARNLGIVDVYAVPVHYPGGDFGLCVSLSDHSIDDKSERKALQIASILAHQRCFELGGSTDATSSKRPMTPREVECLRWVLKGKSDSDIGAILGISPSTVHFHIERVKTKLGVKTRTQAAATVVGLGFI